jgi:hypothetical protein
MKNGDPRNANAHNPDVWIDHLAVQSGKFWYDFLLFAFGCYFCLAVICYIAISRSPPELLVIIEENLSFFRSADWLVLDYENFLQAKTQIEATRAWLVEFLTLVVSLTLAAISMLVYLAILMRDSSGLKKLAEKSPFHFDYAWILFGTSVLLGIRTTGFFEGLIFGNYRISTGPSDAVLLFHIAQWFLLQMLLIACAQILIHVIVNCLSRIDKNVFNRKQ